MFLNFRFTKTILLLLLNIFLNYKGLFTGLKIIITSTRQNQF